MSNGEFNKNIVIDITLKEIENYNALSADNIQTFLEREKRGSGKYHISTYTNKRGQRIADLIYWSAQYWGINPKILITTLQKESSLITKSTDNRKIFFRTLDKSFGFGWLDSGRVIALYKGFDMQVFFAARLFRKFIDYYQKQKARNPNIQLKLYIDYNQEVVNAQNPLAYALYKYTPHVAGNKLYWQLWKQYEPEWENILAIKTQ